MGAGSESAPGAAERRRDTRIFWISAGVVSWKGGIFGFGGRVTWWESGDGLSSSSDESEREV